ncbi:MAG: TetR/AcrR family transcriptional regulator [Jatrophihabitans sp.]|uniref:TetR/AcrR family transcriptional regulator n=1 Tax=Jatrophihabitans sp. TaxID=1932789 RepID=UPI003F7CD8BB
MVDVNGELAARLIDVGAQMLAEQGSAGLTLRKLAAAVGTSTMAVYTRFGDKQGLLAAMHREGFRRLGEQVAAAADSADPLEGVGRCYRAFALANPHLYALMFGPPPLGFVPTEEDGKAADASCAPLVEGVRMAVEQGLFTGDPERIALHLWAVAHGMVSLELSGHISIPPAQRAAEYDEALALAAQPFLTRPPDPPA